jgi:hypothetical protein
VQKCEVWGVGTAPAQHSATAQRSTAQQHSTAQQRQHSAAQQRQHSVTIALPPHLRSVFGAAGYDRESSGARGTRFGQYDPCKIVAAMYAHYECTRAGW